MSVSKICEVCSKEFSVPECRSQTARTCSQKCRGVLIAAKYEAERVSCACKQCGSEFKAPACHAGRRVYCSTQCAADAHRGVALGPFTPDGSTMIHSDGYVLERSTNHPFNVAGYVFQHRLVVEGWMREAAPDHPFLVDVGGEKYLRRDIDVHHKDESKDCNNRENLTACTHAAHKAIHNGSPVMVGEVWPEIGDEVVAISRRVTMTCMECGSSYERKLSDVRRGNGKFCSKKCAATWNGRLNTYSVHRKCFKCGLEFKASQAAIKSGRGKFCSNACRHKSRIGRNPKDVIPYQP